MPIIKTKDRPWKAEGISHQAWYQRQRQQAKLRQPNGETEKFTPPPNQRMDEQEQSLSSFQNPALLHDFMDRCELAMGKNGSGGFGDISYSMAIAIYATLQSDGH